MKSNFKDPNAQTHRYWFARNDYDYWRMRIMYSIILGYGLYNFARVNLAMAVPSLKAELGFTNEDVGLIMSVGTLVYSYGRLINGLFSDKANARFFHVFGLIGTAICNIFFGLSNTLTAFVALWALNGWFQTMGGPSCSRMLTHWHAPHEIGTRWAIWSINAPIAGGLIFIVTGYTITPLGWQSAFFIPGVTALLFAPFLLNRMRDNPGEVNLPPIEIYKPLPDTHISTKKVLNEPVYLSVRQIFLKQLLPNKRLWYICMASFCLYLVRTGFLSWCPEILMQVRGLDIKATGWMAAIYEMGCLLGGLLAGWLSDRLFKGQRGHVGVIYMLLLAVIMLYFWLSPYHNRALDGLMLILFGFFSFGPNVMVGAAAADFASKKAVGIATGLVSSVGNWGATLSGYGIGKITFLYGWNYGFIMFIVSALCGAGFFALTLQKNTRR